MTASMILILIGFDLGLDVMYHKESKDYLFNADCITVGSVIDLIEEGIRIQNVIISDKDLLFNAKLRLAYYINKLD